MILDKLADSSQKRVERQKEVICLEQMKYISAQIKKKNFEFEKALRGEGIQYICEVKKASPSKGLIAEHFDYLSIAKEYEKAGASAVSVLTEPEYFKGSDEYLSEISRNITLPIIRKDFVIDEYMIYHAHVMGASAVLLICSLLDTERIKRYINICDDLGLSALVEAHDEIEIDSALKAGARVIGVNNRNLKDFTVDLQNCMRLRTLVPENIAFVAESGIKNREDIIALEKSGVNAVLIGETLMRAENKKKMLDSLRGVQNG